MRCPAVRSVWQHLLLCAPTVYSACASQCSAVQCSAVYKLTKSTVSTLPQRIRRILSVPYAVETKQSARYQFCCTYFRVALRARLRCSSLPAPKYTIPIEQSQFSSAVSCISLFLYGAGRRACLITRGLLI